MEIYNRQRLDIHYDNIFEENREKLISGGEGDGFLLSPNSDARRSLALLIRINKSVSENISKTLEEFKAIEPDLYFYPEKDFHITVLDILRGIPNRKMPDNIEDYIRCIKECAAVIKPFYIELSGMTASSNAALVKGYYEYGLEELRRSLRKTFGDRKLTLEERYKTFSSHITVIRIPEKLTYPNEFMKCVEKERYFGKMRVDSLELVFHNWYDSKRTKLAEIELGSMV